MQTSNIQPLAVSVKDAARMVGLSQSSIWAMIAEGRIEARKIGHRTLVPTSSLSALIDSAPKRVAA